MKTLSLMLICLFLVACQKEYDNTSLISNQEYLKKKKGQGTSGGSSSSGGTSGGTTTGGSSSGGTVSGGSSSGGTVSGGYSSGGSSGGAQTANYYLSPTGNDSNNGSITAPFKTLQKLWTVLQPGNLVYLRGGTYQYTIQQYLIGKHGTSQAPIRIFAYPGEKPVLTRGATFTKPGDQWHRGSIFFSGNYFHWKGLEITGFYQFDLMVDSAFIAHNANYNTFEGFNIHHNAAGAYLEGDSTGNLFLNSDFHHNFDDLVDPNYNRGGNADGLALAYVTAGNSNTVRGCRSWWNSDDGFDAFEHGGLVTFENNWSWNNGFIPDTQTQIGNGVGFKLGSVFLQGSALRNTFARVLKNNLAFNNADWGIHINEGELRAQLYNNVIYNNRSGGINFHYENLPHLFVNNIAFGNDNVQVAISTTSTSTKNASSIGDDPRVWTINASAADFRSVNISGVAGARQADGSLPVLDFLRLNATSPLVNAGMNVGIPFNGTAPDIGAFEN